MATYPSAPAFRLDSKESVYRPIQKSSFEGNYLQVRPISSRARRKFLLNYPNITYAEYQVLEAFFIAHIGEIIDFIHPKTGITYQVTISSETLEMTYTSASFVNTSLELEGI